MREPFIWKPWTLQILKFCQIVQKYESEGWKDISCKLKNRKGFWEFEEGVIRKMKVESLKIDGK